MSVHQKSQMYSQVCTMTSSVLLQFKPVLSYFLLTVHPVTTSFVVFSADSSSSELSYCEQCLASCWQYENQVSILGNWTSKGPTLTRPKWSDATGKVSRATFKLFFSVTVLYEEPAAFGVLERVVIVALLVL